MQLAVRIIQDLNHLNPTVWTLWQAATLQNSLDDKGWGLVGATYCGCVDGESCQCTANQNEGRYTVRMQYYAYKQFTAFITPGSTILRPSTVGRVSNTVAAITANGVLVIVAVNPQLTPLPAKIRVDAQYGTACASVYTTDPKRKMKNTGSIALGSSRDLLEVTLTAESITTFVLDPADKTYVCETERDDAWAYVHAAWLRGCMSTSVASRVCARVPFSNCATHVHEDNCNYACG